jgi:hypothetical protein
MSATTVLYTVTVPLNGEPTIIQLTKTGCMRFADGTPNRAVRAYQALAGGEPDGRAALLNWWSGGPRGVVATLLARHALRHNFVHTALIGRRGTSARVTQRKAGGRPLLHLHITLANDWWRTVYLPGRALLGEAFCLSDDGRNCELIVRRECDGEATFPTFYADSQTLEVWSRAD